MTGRFVCLCCDVHPAQCASLIDALLGTPYARLIYRPRERVVLGLSWISLGLFALYLLNTWLLYQHGH